MKVIKKFISNGWLITSSIATLASGIATSILNGLHVNEWYFYAIFGLFLFSISTVLIQILVFLILIEDKANVFAKIDKSIESIDSNINDIRDNMGDNGSILSPEKTTEAQTELEKLINSRYDEIESIKIICYGTNGYGELINKFLSGVYDKKRKIHLDVMLCSPDAVFLDNKHDREKIIAQEQEIRKDKRFQLYSAKYLPTIRCCAVYGKDKKPIWNCIQHYVYTNENPTSCASYTNSFALIGRENNPKILYINDNCIDVEFNSLKI